MYESASVLFLDEQMVDGHGHLRPSGSHIYLL